MSKSKKKTRNRDRKAPLTGPAPVPEVTTKAASKPSWTSQSVIRESIEAVAIAFILAFLFRTFEAEAFVIPTGSMADTLMGMHKDVTCEECGYQFRVGASNGISSQSGGHSGGSPDVARATCPMCRHEQIVSDERAFSGDRILVNKSIYHLEEPQRWDVAVFKYPGGAKTNFIKRLIGLPNETVRIYRGDLYTQKTGKEEEGFLIERKPPKKVRAMLQMVYDNDHLPERLLAAGWPHRWRPEDEPSGWKAFEDHRSFTSDSSFNGETWLRYRHFAPNDEAWRQVEAGETVTPPDGPQLIADFCAYNSGLTSGFVQGRRNANHLGDEWRGLGIHWVGDLAVSCALDVREDKGEVVLELVEGGRRMQCRFDLTTGLAYLSISGTDFERVGETPVTHGAHEVLFANVDNQLLLWVDGKLIEFDAPTAFEPLGNTIPTEADLSPVGIASTGADVQVGNIKVLRDIYYIAVGPLKHYNERSGLICDYILSSAYLGHPNSENRPYVPSRVRHFLSTPSIWPQAFSESNMRAAYFPLAEDQFMMLGDNSPASKDARLWNDTPDPKYYVDRDLLIGKALFVYWPHSWDAIWIGDKKLPFPFFPNVKRMRLVR
jgi:signal peptidase I